jgi:hypothetical protein
LKAVVNFATDSAAVDAKEESLDEMRNRTAFIEKFKHIGMVDPFPEK